MTVQKSALIEYLKSEGVLDYIEELFKKNTDEIKKSIGDNIQHSSQSQVDTMELQNLENIIVKLKEENLELENKLKTLESESSFKLSLLNQKMMDEMKRRMECQEYNEKIISLLNTYDLKYKEIDNAYSLFLTLSERTLISLKNIFKDKNLFSFLSVGADWDNIIGLWEFIKRKIIEEKTEDLEILKDIFHFCFQFYNSRESKISYQLITPKLFDIYNSDVHSILGKKTDGIIEKVEISGILNINNNKIERKAIVRICEE